jgi:hypothetical protein
VTQSTAPTNLGFLTVLHEPTGYMGGYLVTNIWGRPLEFRLSTAVQPNRVQQILYGDTLAPYICADLIGKTLVDKAATPVHLLVTDTEAALDLRLRLDRPVVWFAPAEHRSGVRVGDNFLHNHASFPEDASVARQLVERLDGSLDLAEPFGRIREAIGEARRMGVTSRT